MKKFTKLFCAVSAVLGASQAMALAPTVTPELTVYLSGASAQDTALLKIVSNLCDAGTLDIFTDAGAAAGTGIANFNAYSCAMAISKLNAANPSSTYAAQDTNGDGKLNVVVYKRSSGGSGEGPNGVCNTAGTTHIVVDNATCEDSVTSTSEVAGDRRWKCSTTAAHVSDGGLSDLEINKLPSAFSGQCDGSTSAKTVVSNPIWGTIFNTPVSLNLRNALQCVQGLSVGAEDEANMPSLPKSVVASLFNGGIGKWDSLYAPRFDGTLVPLNQAVADRVAQGQCAGVTVPTDMRARVCRRPDSSGTNAQFRVKFLNEVCSSEAQPELPDNTPTSTNAPSPDDTVTGYANWRKLGGSPSSAVIIEASSGGNMNNCLSAFADPTAPTTQRWAIGMQSTENNVNRAFNYRFIKIDGAAPTVANVLAQRYNDWVESVWIWSNATPQSKVDFQKVLLDATGQGTDIGTLDASTFVHSFGTAGVVALNTVAGNVASVPTNLANPVATATHAAGGAASSCRTPQVNGISGF